MTSLLAIAVHFLILTQWIILQVTGWVQLDNLCELSVTDDAFDDQYEGCTEEMEEIVPQLLKEELEMNRKLRDEWGEAKKKWEEIKNKINSSEQLNDFQGTALVAYTGNIAIEFNKAVREFGKNSSNFQFKAFHYYLTRALQLLKSKGKCYTVYRRCKAKFPYSGRGNVRFGQFTSSSLSEDIAKRYSNGGETMLTIHTCLGVEIQDFSFYPEEKEVLIPGYEVFQQVITNNNNISLISPQKFKSNFNCFYSSTKNPGIQDSNFNSSGMRESSAFILLLPGLLVPLFLPAEL